MKIHLPGETWIGVMGGGQLGRMLALEARRMGYRVIKWSGGPESGPSDMANEVVAAPFDDEAALEAFTGRADVATVEFENLPFEVMERVAERIPMSPRPEAVRVCQHREREKVFLREHGFHCAWFEVVSSAGELAGALERMPSPEGILKTAEFGYDGKGQLPVRRQDEAEAVWAAFGGGRAVLEERVELEAELSVLVVRDALGNLVCYDPVENRHRDHILDQSIVPARLPGPVQREAVSMAGAIAKALDYHGVLAVEYFLGADGRLLVNELAPRPHNSGHHTLDACATSQFEQQLRVLCGLPLGSPKLLCPAVMLNLLGDLWDEDGRGGPDWGRMLTIEAAKLHLYGKREARPGRKMGHVTFLAETREGALESAEDGRRMLRGDR